MQKRIIGIYKITSPSKRIYIGQSDHVIRRFKSYKRLNCKSQPKLYRSFLKYGVDKHTFEVICECDVERLDSYERYYQELFNCISSKYGLNCILKETDKLRRVYNEDYSLKISKILKGRKFSDETRRKMSESKKGICGLSHNNSVAVKAFNIRTKEIVIESMYNISRHFNVDPELVLKRCRFYFVSPTKLKDWDFEYLNNPLSKKINMGQNKLVIDIDTGIYYYGKTDLATSLNLSLSTFNNRKICEKGRYILC